MLKKSDIDFAKGVTEVLRGEASTSNMTEEGSLDTCETNDIKPPDFKYLVCLSNQCSVLDKCIFTSSSMFLFNCACSFLFIGESILGK